MKTALAVIVLFVTASLLWACAPQASPADPSAQPGAVTTSLPTALETTPTPTAEPSATPEPGKVILFAPEGSDALAVTTLLTELSQQAGLLLDVQPEPQPASLGEGARVAVLLAAPPNLADLLTAAPQTQFVVLSSGDLSPAGNLSVIRLRSEDKAFLAGYISVLLSPDWRSGGLLPADGPLGARLQDAFVNGGRYFCGICAPGWPLGMTYPQSVQLPANSGGPAWQEAAAGLYDTHKTDAYYLSAEASHSEVFAFLQGRDQFGRILLLVGDQQPPDELRGQWAATVGFDVVEPLRQLWPKLLAGQGGAVVQAPLTLTNVNQANMGEGRLRLIQNLMDEMAAGRIYPFSVPQE